VEIFHSVDKNIYKDGISKDYTKMEIFDTNNKETLKFSNDKDSNKAKNTRNSKRNVVSLHCLL